MKIKCDMCEGIIDTEITRPDGTPAGATLCMSDGSRITACSDCIQRVGEEPEYLNEFLEKRENADKEIVASINTKERADYEVGILHEAIHKYGVDSQVDMAIEEMSELTKALLKHRRAISNPNPDILEFNSIISNIHEEMADVQIMLDQLYIIFGTPIKQRFQKIARLKERLDGEKNDANDSK